MINHLEGRNVEAGREEHRSDQELVDCHEIQGSTQESYKEMMKNDEETNDYDDTVQTHDEWHKNCYRTMQTMRRPF